MYMNKDTANHSEHGFFLKQIIVSCQKKIHIFKNMVLINFFLHLESECGMSKQGVMADFDDLHLILTGRNR